MTSGGAILPMYADRANPPVIRKECITDLITSQWCLESFDVLCVSEEDFIRDAGNGM
jgi:hypothetical protein